MAPRQGLRERGAVAVEMAIVLPLLLLILGGIVDFGRAYFTQIVLANAAREGARASVVRADPVLRADAARTGIADEAWLAPEVGPTDLGCAATPTPGEVEVTTRATFRYAFLGIVPGITNPRVLSSTAVMGCS